MWESGLPFYHVGPAGGAHIIRLEPSGSPTSCFCQVLGRQQKKLRHQPPPSVDKGCFHVCNRFHQSDPFLVLPGQILQVILGHMLGVCTFSGKPGTLTHFWTPTTVLHGNFLSHQNKGNTKVGKMEVQGERANHSEYFWEL